MKKEVLSSVIVAVLLLFLPAQATASFHKDVHGTPSKAESTVATSMRAHNTSDGTHSSRAGRVASITETEGQVQVINNLKGFRLESKGTEYYPGGNGYETQAIIRFVLTNETNRTITVADLSKTKAVDTKGNTYECALAVAGETMQVGHTYDFKPGVPVKCEFCVMRPKEEGMTMSLCQIRTLVFVKDWENQFIEFRNIPLPPKPVFKGQWSMKGNGVEGLLDLDFYGKTVDGTDLDGNEAKCFGTIFVAYGSGASVRPDECSILVWQGKGNSVKIAFVGGRSGELYRAVLSFNPVSNTMTITNVKPASEDSFGECYVTDGLVFKKSR